jgi:hypothetical protein
MAFKIGGRLAEWNNLENERREWIVSSCSRLIQRSLLFIPRQFAVILPQKAIKQSLDTRRTKVKWKAYARHTSW